MTRRGPTGRRVDLLAQAPDIAAVLSTPVVAAPVLRAANAVGRGLIRLTRSAWVGLQGLLAKGGSTGETITSGLSSAWRRSRRRIPSGPAPPIPQQVLRVCTAAETLIRPVSHALGTPAGPPSTPSSGSHSAHRFEDTTEVRRSRPARSPEIARLGGR